ncbi:PREDICTED: torsin-1A-like [Polistes dominula]|uniref:Torsin-1A-like n=1 Tax=Polistes dominula TaxID=743375 RepID=A0ABM1HVY0_POLDO|nr:PREDICTED: torsin-1A-like [Polistes dominula]
MNVFLYVALLSCCIILTSCEVLTTLGVMTGASVLGGYVYNKIQCKYFECCTDEYIKFDLEKLDKLMQNKLYGQHIAYKTILNALHGYLNNKENKKALSLSFHGPQGTGKNYVTQFIAQSLYRKGTESKFFHFFNGREDFPLTNETENYKIALQTKIKAALKACPRSLFVFDEVDKMPEGILNAIVHYLDYNTWPKDYVGNEAIFLFLSNTGSRQIVQRLLNLWESGVKRQNTKLQDFENLISIGAFNEKGGFHLSDTIETSVIDHYIPFLPLEEEDVKKCIRHAFKKRLTEETKVTEITPEMVEEALSHLTFDPPPHNLYSKSGCKRIEQKVAIIMHPYKK